jgi:hypothetical protein
MPPLFSFTTKHSRKRVSQRTGLTFEAVELILNSGQFIDAGSTKPGFGAKRFLVFYDSVLQECCVAVQRVTGKIHTVLPRRFSKQSFPWIADEIFEKVQRRYERSVLMTEKERARAALEAEMKASQSRRKKKKTQQEEVFTIQVKFKNKLGNPKVQKLLSIPSTAYSHCVANLLEDKDLPEKLQSAFNDLTVSEDWSIHGLVIRSCEELVYLPL